MASNELIIDDDYCKAMGAHFVKQGEQLDQVLSEYVQILKEIRAKAITKGDVSQALDSYISYAEKLNKQIGNISQIAKTQIDNYLYRVDAADQYLF